MTDGRTGAPRARGSGARRDLAAGRRRAGLAGVLRTCLCAGGRGAVPVRAARGHDDARRVPGRARTARSARRTRSAPSRERPLGTSVQVFVVLSAFEMRANGGGPARGVNAYLCVKDGGACLLQRERDGDAAGVASLGSCSAPPGATHAPSVDRRPRATTTTSSRSTSRVARTAVIRGASRRGRGRARPPRGRSSCRRRGHGATGVWCARSRWSRRTRVSSQVIATRGACPMATDARTRHHPERSRSPDATSRFYVSQRLRLHDVLGQRRRAAPPLGARRATTAATGTGSRSGPPARARARSPRPRRGARLELHDHRRRVRSRPARPPAGPRAGDDLAPAARSAWRSRVSTRASRRSSRSKASARRPR